MAQNRARGEAKLSISFSFHQLPNCFFFSLHVIVVIFSFLLPNFQTIYGEILPIHSNDDVAGLTRFLTDRLLGNPDIAKAFAHPQVPGLYREGESRSLLASLLS